MDNTWRWWVRKGPLEQGPVEGGVSNTYTMTSWPRSRRPSTDRFVPTFPSSFFLHLTWRDENPISGTPAFAVRFFLILRAPRAGGDTDAITTCEFLPTPHKTQMTRFRLIIVEMIVFGGSKLQSKESSWHTHQNRGARRLRQSFSVFRWLMDSFGCKWGACRDV